MALHTNSTGLDELSHFSVVEQVKDWNPFSSLTRKFFVSVSANDVSQLCAG